METSGIITKNSDGTLTVPDFVTIPFIEGDGIGPDIWRATQTVIDGATEISCSAFGKAMVEKMT